MKKWPIIVAIIIATAARGFLLAHAQTMPAAGTAATSSLQAQIDTNNQQIDSLNQQIATYQAELQKVGADKKTLQAAIKALDLQKSKVQAQTAVTQKQIGITQLQIQQLGENISDTKQTITENQTALGTVLRLLQKTDDQPLALQMLSGNTLAEVWSNVNDTVQVQEAVQNKVQALKTQEGTLTDSQTASQQKQATLTAQKQALASQQASLVATVQSKNQLLAETSAKESTYQKLLAAAEAELKSFSAFAQNAGGSKLLTGQTDCDAWGCYYNQRDAAWGNTALNGTEFKLASDGCLVTSMAMIMTHYGYKNVTPALINADPSNFASYYPAYLLTTISVEGMTVTRKTTTINTTLATGNPVVVGVHAYGGTHFVVLTSKSGSDYLMRDPYIANGKDISFAAHYSLKNIFSIAKVVIGG